MADLSSIRVRGQSGMPSRLGVDIGLYFGGSGVGLRGDFSFVCIHQPQTCHTDAHTPHGHTHAHAPHARTGRAGVSAQVYQLGGGGGGSNVGSPSSFGGGMLTEVAEASLSSEDGRGFGSGALEGPGGRRINTVSADGAC